jgi:hypothetical protein
MLAAGFLPVNAMKTPKPMAWAFFQAEGGEQAKTDNLRVM